MNDAPLPLNVLVTGGTGFVGKTVVAELVRRGHDVIATTQALSAELTTAPNLRWISWNVLNEPLPQVDWRRLRAILHLASPTKPFHFPEQAALMYELTVAATFRFLEAAREHGVPRVLLASTGHVLGSNERPNGEDDVLYVPDSFYGTTKACAELLLRAYPAVVSTAILRFYYPYGPAGEAFLMNRLVNAVIEEREIRIEGEDGIRISPVWIEDLARGVALAVESSESGIFHFPGPEIVSMRELVELIGTLTDKRPRLRSEPVPCIQRHAGSFEITRQRLGYNPRVFLREGVSRLLAATEVSQPHRGA